MRTVSSSIMTVLVVVALFWGNCFSCPQFLQLTQHGCCHRSKTASTICNTQSLRHFVKADAHLAPPALPVVAETRQQTPAFLPLSKPEPSRIDHAPPGHTTSLRI
jgi:hypothetical protein